MPDAPGSAGDDRAGPPADGSPERRLLRADGRPVLAFTPSQQQRPTADGAEALTPLALVVPTVLAQLSGWWLTSPDDRLTDALLAAGATVVRHAHLYSRTITPADATLDGGFDPEPYGTGSTGPLPGAAGGAGAGPGNGLAGLRVGPVTRPVAELAVVSARAYGPDHLDHLPGGEADEAAELGSLLSGELVGPVVAHATFQAVAPTPDGAGAVVGVIIVNRSPDPAPTGGPWVSQVFRHPDPAWAGLGAQLVERAIGALAAGGDTTLGLAVTAGNPAERVYRRLGFRHLSSHRKLALPD